MKRRSFLQAIAALVAAPAAAMLPKPPASGFRLPMALGEPAPFVGPWNPKIAGTSVAVSKEILEDSIIEIIPQIRKEMAQALAEETESWIINGESAK